MKNVVSSGHRLTSAAAHSMFCRGGNAFDAAVAACFASFATEPMLTGAASAGIGLLRKSSKGTKCVDFLSDFPSNGMDKRIKPIRKIANFIDDEQVFYLGRGSIGTPGSLPGLMHIHRKYCTLELATLLEPAIRYAKSHKVNSLQAFVFRVLELFCVHSKESRKIYAPQGKLLQRGDVIRNPKFATFLSMLAKDEDSAMDFYHCKLDETLSEGKNSLSMDDVSKYRVYEHRPVSVEYHNYSVELAPPPSAGGLLIAHALAGIEKSAIGKLKHNSARHIRKLISVMEDCESARTAEFFRHLLYERGFYRKFLKRPNYLGGTTHISTIDSEGNAASITTSNGEGSGIMINDSGIMLNNFAAEPDLMQYKELYQKQKRITTMMSPCIIGRGPNLEAVLGSGGSNRIRSAILETISNIIDFRMPPQKATDSPRAHYEQGMLQLEGGIRKSVADELSKEYKTKLWSGRNLFFGGVHIATPTSGGGDKRRGGSLIVD